MSFLNLEACTNLMRGDTKIVVRRLSYSLSGLRQPYNPYAEVCAQWRILHGL